MHRLNPFDKDRKRQEKDSQEKSKATRDQSKAARNLERAKHRKQGKVFLKTFKKQKEDEDNETIRDYNEYVLATKVGGKVKLD